MCLGATAHPTAEWITCQPTEAYGWEAAPQYVVCDRDAVYGDIFIRRLRAMGIRDRPTAARSLGKMLAATVIAPLYKSFAATSLCGCGY